MALRNWIQLGALLLIAAAGVAVWLLCRAMHRRHDGYEGIVEERGLPPMRQRMDVEEEIARLEQLLGKNEHTIQDK